MISNAASFQPSISFLNALGDITIAWEDENKAKVVKLVEKKMKEGYTFFIVREPGRRGVDPKLKSVDEISKATQNKLRVSTKMANNIEVADDDLASAFANGAIVITRKPEKKSSTPTTAVRRAKTASEVVGAQSVAVKPVRGG